MKNNQITYSIQQVADKVGLSKQLIRKWEDRYGIIVPNRLDNGYRVYTDHEVTILREVKRLTEEGHSPKQAAEIVKTQQMNQGDPTHSVLTNPTMPYSFQSPKNTEQSTNNPVAQVFLDQLIVLGTDGNDVGMLRLLQQAHLVMDVQSLLDQVVTPFLHCVGDLWCEKIWGEYQEAMASLVVRDFLANLRRTIPVPDHAPLILGSCLPGERHEIPMHLLLIQCMIRGYYTVMLGPSPAPAAIESTVALKKPDIVLLTASTNIPFEERLAEIKELNQFAAVNPEVRFYLGGASAQKFIGALSHITITNELATILER